MTIPCWNLQLVFNPLIAFCLTASKPQVNMRDETVEEGPRTHIPKSQHFPVCTSLPPLPPALECIVSKHFTPEGLSAKYCRPPWALNSLCSPSFPPLTNLDSPASTFSVWTYSALQSPCKLLLALSSLSSIPYPTPQQKLLGLGYSHAQITLLMSESHPVESQNWFFF